MKIDTHRFRIVGHGGPDLDERPTRVDPVYGSQHDYRQLLDDHIERLSDRQDHLFAAGRESVLILFQAMDAAGKDGVIKHVMSGVNPQGCQVFSFKHPGPTELQHDFLWRFQACLPERGRIGIFNRSYYEEVLIARVHPEILFTESRIDPATDPDVVFQGRFESIRNFEGHLSRNGVKIVKIHLHLSRGEQRRRFLARIDTPGKNWKLSLSDMQERTFWRQYQSAYQAAIHATASETAPWFVVPADDKPNARLIVSEILLDAFADLDLEPPVVTPAQRRALAAFRRTLAADDGE